jgi:hypothetical protein
MKPLTNKSISDIARTNSQISKKLNRYNADPNRLYDGGTRPYEDSADYLKLGVIKAVRVG